MSNPIQVPVRQDEPVGLASGFFFLFGAFFSAVDVMNLHSLGRTDAKKDQAISDDFLNSRHQKQAPSRQNWIIG